MKISCPACSAKYSIADEKIMGRLAKIRCRKCSATVVIDGKVDPPSIQLADADTERAEEGESVSAGQYAVDFGEGGQQTMTVAEIVAAYHAGEVGADTYVWEERMTDWATLADVPEIAQALHSAAGHTESEAEPEGQSESLRVTSPQEPELSVASMPEPTVSEAPVQRAAVAEAGRRAPDLFGGIAKAGSEEDVTTSAPEPAPDRVHAATGARNESSVLFSLSALTASGGADSKHNEEDSGLIDLGALTSQAQHDRFDPGAVASPLAVGALGFGSAAPVPVAPLADFSAEMGGRGNKSGLLIGGSILGASIVIAVTYLAVQFAGGGPAPAPSDAAMAAAAANPEKTTSAMQAAAGSKSDQNAADSKGMADADKSGDKADDDKAMAEDEDEADKKSSARKPVARSARPAPGKSPASGTGSSSSPASESKPEPAAAKKPAPAPVKACNCKPGDLMCAIRCRAK